MFLAFMRGDISRGNMRRRRGLVAARVVIVHATFKFENLGVRAYLSCQKYLRRICFYYK